MNNTHLTDIEWLIREIDSLEGLKDLVDADQHGYIDDSIAAHTIRLNRLQAA